MASIWNENWIGNQDFSLGNQDFSLGNQDSSIGNQDSSIERVERGSMLQNDEFCVTNDEFCIENDELCNANDWFYNGIRILPLKNWPVSVSMIIVKAPDSSCLCVAKSSFSIQRSSFSIQNPSILNANRYHAVGGGHERYVRASPRQPPGATCDPSGGILQEPPARLEELVPVSIHPHHRRHILCVTRFSVSNRLKIDLK